MSKGIGQAWIKNSLAEACEQKPSVRKVNTAFQSTRKDSTENLCPDPCFLFDNITVYPENDSDLQELKRISG